MEEQKGNEKRAQGGEATDVSLKAEKIARKFENALVEELVIQDEDLRLLIGNIYRSDLECLRNLKVLKLERCQIESF
jgi:hypothetical protein